MAVQRSIVGLILAGGAGRRLGGVRKGDLRLGNVPLRKRVLDRLRPSCQAILYSSGTSDAHCEDAVALPDSPDGVAGPAAGLLAGARWCRDNFPEALMLSASVDTPFFPADFLDRALDSLDENHGCVVGAYGGRDYPTNALWRPERLLGYLEAIPPAPRGPRLRDVQAAVGGAELDYTGIAPDNPFAGVNRLVDLLALESRLEMNGDLGVGKRTQIG